MHDKIKREQQSMKIIIVGLWIHFVYILGALLLIKFI